MARFEGTDNYVATNDLKMAVNAAITLERIDRHFQVIRRNIICLLYTSPSPRDRG